MSLASTFFRKDYFDSEDLSSSLRERAMRGAGATVFCQIAGHAISMAGTIILARLLTPDDFGLVAMVALFIMLIQNFGVSGFTEAIIQAEEISHQQVSTLFWLHVLLSLGLTIAFMAVAPLIALFYEEARLQLIARIISFSILLSGLSTHHIALLKRNMRFYTSSAIELGAVIVSVTAAVILAWWGWGYWALVARRIIIALVTTISAWMICRWRPGLPSKGTIVGPIIRFAINTYGNFAVSYFAKNLDKLLIGWRYNTTALGFYDRAYHMFVMPVNQFTYPLTNVAIAALSRMRSEPIRYHRYFLNALSMISLVGMGLGGILTLIGDDLIFWLLGPSWSRAGRIVTVFGPGVGVMMVYATRVWLHLSLGRADRLFAWAIISFMVTTIFIVCGLPFGSVGVAAAYTTLQYVLVAPALWYAGRPIDLRLSVITSAVWRYFAAALAATLLSWAVIHSDHFALCMREKFGGLPSIVVSVAGFLCLYLSLVVVLHRSVKPIVNLCRVFFEMLPWSITKQGKSRSNTFLS